MDGLLMQIGRLAGALGVLLSVVAGGARLAGRYVLGPVQAGTLLVVGMAAMILACLCLLTVLTNRVRP
jgi:hypothetical protein